MDRKWGWGLNNPQIAQSALRSSGVDVGQVVGSGGVPNREVFKMARAIYRSSVPVVARALFVFINMFPFIIITGCSWVGINNKVR